MATPAVLWAQDTAPEIKFRDMPTKNGFSAELRLTTNKDVFQELVPNPEHFTPVDKVKRGVPFYTAILFANAASKDGKPDMVYTIEILRPDGSVYATAKDIPGWRNRPPAVPGLVHIAMGSLTISIDPDDPSGTYTVIANISDRARGDTVIHSERLFTVE